MLYAVLDAKWGVNREAYDLIYKFKDLPACVYVIGIIPEESMTGYMTMAEFE